MSVQEDNMGTKNSTCLICLKSKIEQETLQVVENNLELHQCIDLNGNPCEVEMPEVQAGEENCTSDLDPYKKFLCFAGSYLNLNIPPMTTLFLPAVGYFAQNKDNNLRVFCSTCKACITEVCQLYDELTEIQIRLNDRIGLLGELLRNGNKSFSRDLLSHAYQSLAEQLCITVFGGQPSHARELRELLIAHCKLKITKGKGFVSREGGVTEELGNSSGNYSDHPERSTGDLDCLAGAAGLNSNQFQDSLACVGGCPSDNGEKIQVEIVEYSADEEEIKLYNIGSEPEGDPLRDDTLPVVVDNWIVTDGVRLDNPELDLSDSDSSQWEPESPDESCSSEYECTFSSSSSDSRSDSSNSSEKKLRKKSIDRRSQARTTQTQLDEPFNKSNSQNDACSLDEDEDEAYCGTCKTDYLTLSALHQHISDLHEIVETSISSSRKFQCYLCHLCFDTGEARSTHVKLERKRKNGHILDFQCEKHSRTFASCAELMDHYNSSEHSKPNKPNCFYKCHKCQWPFLTKFKRDLHELIHYKELSVSADKHKSFSVGSITFNEEEITGEYVCSPQRLGRPCKSKNRTCTECKKDFPTQYHLRRHLTLHQEKLRCNLCQVRFQTEDDLQKHKGSTHNNNVEQSQPNLYPCGDCDKTFDSLTNLYKHKQTSHSPLEAQILLRRLHHCPHCVKAFVTSALLKNHLDEGKCPSKSKALQLEEIDVIELTNSSSDESTDSIVAVNVDPLLIPNWREPKVEKCSSGTANDLLSDYEDGDSSEDEILPASLFIQQQHQRASNTKGITHEV